MLETKYGKIIKARPLTSGTTVFCRLPYTKKASPIEPKSRPHKRVEVFIATPERLTSRLSGQAQVFAARHERKIAQCAHGGYLRCNTGRSKRWLDRFDLTNEGVKVSRIQACIPVVISTEFQSRESVFVGSQSAAHGLV